MNLTHIAARAYNRPLLLHPEQAASLFGYLNTRVGIESMIKHDGEKLSTKQASTSDMQERIKKTYSVDGGIAIIPIEGTLVHKSGYIGSNSGMTGYDGIAAQLECAASDNAVRGILLDIDSGGGEVSGVEAAAAKIQEISKIKPVWAHANEMAASAAYWLASSADKVYLASTASVGSIGVLVAHRDKSKKLANEGEAVTLIYSGTHKVDGNPYEPLPDDVRADIQSEIDGLRNVFAQTVAKNRNLSVDAVLGTEARVFNGQDAVGVGLADGVLPFEATLDKFKGFLLSSSTAGNQKGLPNMVNQENPQATAGVTDVQLSDAVLAATLQGAAQGAASERERIAAILGGDEAKGREATALKLATTTDLGVEAIAGILATMPTTTGVNVHLSGMSQGAGVNVEAVAENSAASLSILEAARAAQGAK